MNQTKFPPCLIWTVTYFSVVQVLIVQYYATVTTAGEAAPPTLCAQPTELWSHMRDMQHFDLDVVAVGGKHKDKFTWHHMDWKEERFRQTTTTHIYRGLLNVFVFAFLSQLYGPLPALFAFQKPWNHQAAWGHMGKTGSTRCLLSSRHGSDGEACVAQRHTSYFILCSDLKLIHRMRGIRDS